MTDRTDPGPLIQRATRGDRAAVGRILEGYLPDLRAFVRLNTGPALRARETADDLVQSACRHLLENLSGFRYQGERAFRGYLFRAALNHVLNKGRHWRAAGRALEREERLADDSGRWARAYETWSTPDREVVRAEDVRRIEAAFDELPPVQRRVVTMRRMLEVPTSEIAVELDLTTRQVHAEYGRGIARLVVLLREP